MAGSYSLKMYAPVTLERICICVSGSMYIEYDESKAMIFWCIQSIPHQHFQGWATEWSKLHYFSDYWLFKGDYLKIDNVVIGYTFNHILRNKSSSRVGAGIQNLAMINNIRVSIPKCITASMEPARPLKRMYMFSLNLKILT